MAFKTFRDALTGEEVPGQDHSASARLVFANYDEAWKWLEGVFGDGEADEMNWVFFSTYGVAGSYLTLDDPDMAEVRELTYLYLQPRRHQIVYGQVSIRKVEDVAFLRRLARSTIAAVIKSQVGNLPGDQTIAAVDAVRILKGAAHERGAQIANILGLEAMAGKE